MHRIHLTIREVDDIIQQNKNKFDNMVTEVKYQLR